MSIKTLAGCILLALIATQAVICSEDKSGDTRELGKKKGGYYRGPVELPPPQPSMMAYRPAPIPRVVCRTELCYRRLAELETEAEARHLSEVDDASSEERQLGKKKGGYMRVAPPPPQPLVYAAPPRCYDAQPACYNALCRRLAAAAPEDIEPRRLSSEVDDSAEDRQLGKKGGSGGYYGYGGSAGYGAYGGYASSGYNNCYAGGYGGAYGRGYGW